MHGAGITAQQVKPVTLAFRTSAASHPRSRLMTLGKQHTAPATHAGDRDEHLRILTQPWLLWLGVSHWVISFSYPLYHIHESSKRNINREGDML